MDASVVSATCLLPIRSQQSQSSLHEIVWRLLQKSCVDEDPVEQIQIQICQRSHARKSFKGTRYSSTPAGNWDKGNMSNEVLCWAAFNLSSACSGETSETSSKFVNLVSCKSPKCRVNWGYYSSITSSHFSPERKHQKHDVVHYVNYSIITWRFSPWKLSSVIFPLTSHPETSELLAAGACFQNTVVQSNGRTRRTKRGRGSECLTHSQGPLPLMPTSWNDWVDLEWIQSQLMSIEFQKIIDFTMISLNWNIEELQLRMFA